jgi:hypothetical protein
MDTQKKKLNRPKEYEVSKTVEITLSKYYDKLLKDDKKDKQSTR